MDPDVAVNVVRPNATGAEREAEHARQVGATSPYGAAGVMKLDDVIDPAETRVVLAHDLARLAGRRVRPPEQRPLATWATC